MASWAIPGLVALAAFVLMYFTCMRPMRRGHCGMPMSSTEASSCGENATDSEKQVQQLRLEIAQLRHDLEQSAVE